jgi:hypothetical protein
MFRVDTQPVVMQEHLCEQILQVLPQATVTVPFQNQFGSAFFKTKTGLNESTNTT